MKYRLIIFLLIISILSIAGCKKSKQNKLTGSWELLPQTADVQYDEKIYKFDSGNILYITTNDSLVDTADYRLESDFFKYYVVITGIGGGVDGRYYIEKMNRKVLILQCQAPYLRKEFTRHEE